MNARSIVPPAADVRALIASAIAGTAAVTVGIGLARFAFIVIMPALVAAGWFTPGETAWLGAANLLGYFVGALTTHRLAHRIAPGNLVRLAMIAATVSFFACAFDLGYAWFFGWRLVSGVAGAMLMVLASPTVLADTPEALRGRVNGIVFTGVGIGVVVAGFLVPLLAQTGVKQVWLGLGLVSLAMTALSWRRWRLAAAAHPAQAAAVRDGGEPPVDRRSITLLLTLYALNAVGFLPHTVFWVDYLVRALGQSLTAGGLNWTVFGLGALLGPVVAGAAADMIGFRRALAAALAIKGAALAIPLFTVAPGALLASAFIVGALTPGVVTLVSGAALEVVGRAAHRRAWGNLTLSFACSQAAMSSVMAFVFAHTGSYNSLFVIAASALAVAAVLPLFLSATKQRPVEAAV